MKRPPWIARLAERWRNASLQTHFVAVILLASVPIAVALTWKVWADAAATRATTAETIRKATHALAQAVEHELHASFDALEALAAGEGLRTGELARFRRQLQSPAQMRRPWSSVFLADETGRVLLDTAAASAVTPTFNALVRRVVASGNAGASDLEQQGEHASRTYLAIPLYTASGAVQVLGARIDAGLWQRLLFSSTSAPEGGFLALFDGNYRLIARVGRGDTSPGLALPPGAVRSMQVPPPTDGTHPATSQDNDPLRARQAGVQQMRLIDGTPALVGWQPLDAENSAWGVGAGLPSEPLETAERTIVLSTISTAGLSLLLGVTLALLLSHRITQPLKTLAEAGPAALPERVAVREVGMLRDALVRAQAADRAAAEQLQRNAAEFQTLFENIPIGLAFARDAACRVVQRNPAMDRLLGGPTVPAGTVEVLHAGQRLEPGQQPLQRACLQGQTIRAMEMEVRILGREPMHLVATAVPLLDAMGRPRGALAAVMDITELKAVQSRLGAAYEETQQLRQREIEREQQARRDAEAASQAKDEFLLMLGHELRNPLGAISAAAEVLQTGAGGKPMADKAVDIVLRQSERLTRMLGELLDVARTVTGSVTLVRQRIDLAELAERVATTMEVTGQSSHHPLGTALAPACIEADADRIEQIVTNLLSNAFVHTPPGTRVTLAVRVEDRQAVLSVADAGPGIAPDLLLQIFDLFVQGPRAPDRPQGGMGVGLTLARRLAEMHGGSIEAASSEAGSVFTVLLPLAVADATSAAPAPPSDRPLPSLRIVLVDDHDDVRTALCAVLRADGHQVITEGDGIAGLKRILKDWPDIAIVDIGLPGMSGLELARRARGEGYAGRMVAISGYGKALSDTDARRAGFDSYLVKPVTAHQLRSTMR